MNIFSAKIVTSAHMGRDIVNVYNNPTLLIKYTTGINGGGTVLHTVMHSKQQRAPERMHCPLTSYQDH